MPHQVLLCQLVQLKPNLKREYSVPGGTYGVLDNPDGGEHDYYVVRWMDPHGGGGPYPAEALEPLGQIAIPLRFDAPDIAEAIQSTEKLIASLQAYRIYIEGHQSQLQNLFEA